MPEFKFECVHDSVDGEREEVTVKSNAITLDDVIESFSLFLKGCGYQFDTIEYLDGYETEEEEEPLDYVAADEPCNNPECGCGDAFYNKTVRVSGKPYGG